MIPLGEVMESITEEIIGKYIDVAQHKELSDFIPDKKLEIVEIIPPEEVTAIRERYTPYLEGIDANPIAVTLGDEMIFIGSGPKNEGNVYYVDIEFGVFKLHNSISKFLSAIKF